MNFSAKDLTKKLTIPIIVSLICIMIAVAGPSLSDLLRYDSEAIANHEMWRLITPHFVHLSWSHLVMNLLGLALVFLFFARCLSWQYWIATFFVSAIGISWLIFLLNTEVRWYVGLSGVLHALFMIGGLADIRVRKWEGISFTTLIIIKVIYEQIYGPLPGSEEAAGGPVLTDAHFYGAIIGGLGGVIYLFKDDTRRS